jgi:hypothetical protein
MDLFLQWVDSEDLKIMNINSYSITIKKPCIENFMINNVRCIFTYIEEKKIQL